MTLRNDATRLRIVTKDKRKLRSVVGRQGQVLLDADFDQNSGHHLDRIETETVDILGSPGRFVVPAGNNGFKVSGAPGSLDIGAGHGYLGGWLVENAASCKLNNQPHPRADSLTAPAIVGIKALVRHIDPVEDPVLADLALGDAQAGGRSLVDWQVFPLNLPAGPISCATALSNPLWQKLTAPSTGTLAAKTKAAAPSSDPCSLTPGGGYTRLENLLYRVEVHDGVVDATFPTIDGPRFGVAGLKLKISRRNASVMARVTKVASDGIDVTPPRLDPRNWFAPGTFAEIVSIHDDVDPRAALPPNAARMFRVANASDDRVVLEGTLANIQATGIATDGTWFLRLWDALPTGDGLATVTLPSGTISPDIDLGDGVSICLGIGSFRRGDYWTFAARADGTIDWPAPGGLATQMTPHGPEVRYAPLAVLIPTPAPGVFEDCRIPFATLTDKALLYRGGDGQSIAAPIGSGMTQLKATLRLAVMRGETPAVNVPVRFSFLQPSGSSCLLNGTVCNAGTSPEFLSDANGLIEVTWSIDGAKQLEVHKVQAAIATGPGTIIQPPVVFAATFETARHTTYEPGNCKHLLGVDNVQDAIDTLCKHIDDKKAMGLTQIQLYDSSRLDFALIDKEWILNGQQVSNDAFVNGIYFGFDEAKLDIKPADYDPLVEVELELPYPNTDYDAFYWAAVARHPGGVNKTETISGPFGFHRIRLDGKITLGDGTGIDGKKKIGKSTLIWTPSVQAQMFLQTVYLHHWGQTMLPSTVALLKEAGWGPDPIYERICCRIRLRGADIYAKDEKTGDRLYLNAEYLGDRTTITRRELSARDRDPQRAGDLDMFIYLAYTPPGIKKADLKTFFLNAINGLSQ